MKKTAVIVTDGAGLTRNIADRIAASLADKCRVFSFVAPDFKGNDILPADLLFIGCVKPAPSSFAYLEEFLNHVNFAGRPCGLFSDSGKTMQYLRKLIHDSELIPAKPFISEEGADLQKWIKGLLP